MKYQQIIYFKKTENCEDKLLNIVINIQNELKLDLISSNSIWWYDYGLVTISFNMCSSEYEIVVYAVNLKILSQVLSIIAEEIEV